MANRYWVGASGSQWNTTNTANWSGSSGGASGASVPTSADNVFFDQAGTFSVPMTGALACLSLTVSAGTVTFSSGTTPTLQINGSISLIAGTVWTMTGAVTLAGSSTRTVTTNGVTIASPITINATGGTITLGDSLTLSNTLGLTLTAGTLALSTFTLTVVIFSSSNSNTRTLDFGTGKIVLTATNTTTIWTTSTVTGLTVSGTPLVECTCLSTVGPTKTITTGALSEANAISFSLLSPSGSSVYSLGTSVFKNLITDGVQTVSNSAIIIYGTFTHTTVNGTTTFTAGTSSWTFSATSGSYTITNISGFTYDFPWTFGSATSTATWTLAANLTLGATRQLTLTNGTTDFNSKTISAAGITIVTGTPTIANTGTASFTTTLPITHTSGTLTLPFNLTTSSTSGYTFTAGTLALGTFTLTTTIFSSTGTGVRTLNFGTGKIVLNGSATATIWNMAVTTSLTVSGTSLVECQGGGTGVTKTISISASVTIAQCINFSLLETTGTATYAFSSGAGIASLIVNGSQTISNTSLYLFNFTHLITNGTTTFTAGANAWVFWATSGSYTIGNIAGFTYDFPWIFGNASSTATWTLANNLTLGATRQLTLRNGTTDFNSKTISAAGITILTGTPTIANTGTGSLSLTVPITHTSGTLTLPFNITTSSASGYTLTAGTLALSTFTLTTTIFSSSGTGTRTLNYGTGQLALTSNSATIFDVTTATNFTTSGTVYINATYTGSTGTRTLVTGFTEAQAASYNVSTSGTAGIVLSPSATDIVALTGSFNTVNLTGFTGTLSNTTRTIFGNLTIPASDGTYSAGTNVTTFGDTGTATITTNGRTLDFPITFSGVGGTFQLADALTIGSTRTVTLTAGTLNLNNFTLTALALSSSGSTARVIAFGTTGQITLVGNSATIIEMSTLTSFTYTGTARIYATYNGATGTRTFNIGNTTGAVSTNVFDVSFGSSGTGLVIAAATDIVTLNGIYFNGDFTNNTSTISNVSRSFYGNLTIPATGGTFTAGTLVTTIVAAISVNINVQRTIDFPFTVNSVGGTLNFLNNFTLGSTRALTLTAGTLALSTYTISAGSFSSSGSLARTVAYGTGQLALSGTGTVFDTTTATNFSSTGTVYVNASSVSGTKTMVTGFTEAQAASYNVSTSGTSGIVINTTDVITLTGSFFSINLTGFAGTLTNTTRTIFGNLTVPASGGTLTAGANATTFSDTGTATITTNGRTLDFPITINGVGGTFVLADALTLGSTRAFTHTNGTLDLDGKTLTVGSYVTALGTKTLIFDGGTIVPLGDWNNAQPANFTISTGTATGTISMVSATAKTFTGNSANYNCIIDQSGAGALTITGNNIFNQIKSSYANTTGNTSILLPTGNTTIITSITGGSANNKLLDLSGSANSVRANIVISNSSIQTASFLQTNSVIFIANTFSTNGAAPWKWYLANSINNGDTFGAVFQEYSSSAPFVYYINSGTSFSVPSDWNNSNNAVHIYGAGGGSAGNYLRTAAGDNRLGSAGGGGGGYTQVVNFSTSPGGSVSYSIGAGGTAGTANNNGGIGGNTTFASIYTANGGGGSSITSTAATPGVGGTGATYNGGDGGDGGGIISSAENSAGGGGGGSGGPFGVGAKGGKGANNASATTTAGGGGGGSGGGTAGANAAAAVAGTGGNNFFGKLAGGIGGLGLTAGATSGGRERGRASSDILNSAGGAGGGGGGGGHGPGVRDLVSIGGGAGGSGVNDSGTRNAGTAGQSGGIIILYYPFLSINSGSMFLMF